MSEFKVIETQEQFDEAIKARLERDRKSYAKQFEEEMKAKGWKSPEDIEMLTKDLNTEIATLKDAAAKTEQMIADKDTQIAEGEKYRSDLAKTRIAIGMGLPLDMAERINGTNETEWKADAQKILDGYQAFVKSQNRPSPLGNPENASGTSTRDQFSSWASQVFNN